MILSTSIIAISKINGWAIVNIDDDIFLLKPPYFTSNLIKITEQKSKELFDEQGFEELDREFSSLSEVIFFIKKNYLSYKKGNGEKLLTPEEIKKGLQYLTIDDIKKYILNIEEKIIQLGKYDIGEDIVINLLNLEIVQKNEEILTQLIRILNIMHDNKGKYQDSLNNDIDKDIEWTKKYPRVHKKYGIKNIIQFQNNISDRDQLLIINRG